MQATVSPALVAGTVSDAPLTGHVGGASLSASVGGASIQGSVSVAGISGTLSSAELAGQLAIQSGMETYSGAYEAAALFSEQTFATAGKRMASDFEVHAINYTEAPNDSGVTLTIGG